MSYPARSTPVALLAGAVGTAAALFVLLAARLSGGPPGILEVVADAIVLRLPSWLFAAGIQALGPLAKPLLFAGVSTGLLVVGAALAMGLARARLLRGPWPRDAATLAGVAVGLGELLVLPLAGAGPLGVDLVSDAAWVHGPLALAGLAYGLLGAAWLRARMPRPGAPAPEPPGPPTAAEIIEDGAVVSPRPVPRRSVLEGAVLLAAASALLGSGAILVARGRRAAATALPGAPGEPEGVQGFGFTRAVTPVPEFYFVSKDYVPLAVDGATWRLRVDGMVERPSEWTLDELRAMPGHEGYRTLQCISAVSTRRETLIGNQRWRGVRVSDLLDSAGVHPAAAFVILRCADGYHESLPLDLAVDDDTWVAYEMGPPGTLLPPEHGFPARLLVAGRYGMKQPKHLVDLVLADRDDPGWWVRGGWQTDAPIRTYCRIDLPAADGVSDAVLAAHAFTAYGVASSGDRGISRVEVSLDGGATWRDAELEPLGGPIGPLTWVRWRAPVLFEREGPVLFLARATDGRGTVQDATVEDPFPRGSSGYPRVEMRVYASLP